MQSGVNATRGNLAEVEGWSTYQEGERGVRHVAGKQGEHKAIDLKAGNVKATW
jgi:hypothetical protein